VHSVTHWYVKSQYPAMQFVALIVSHTSTLPFGIGKSWHEGPSAGAPPEPDETPPPSPLPPPPPPVAKLLLAPQPALMMARNKHHRIERIGASA
jgi:hypothetical protein